LQEATNERMLAEAKKGNEGWRVCSRFDREGIIVVTAQAYLNAETYTRMCIRGGAL
jgi:hypothetical protein